MDESTFMEIAWRDFINWAVTKPEMISAFEASSGQRRLTPPKNALDAMIDKATGAHKAYAQEFMLWATEHHWGIDDAPAKVRDEIERRRDRRSGP